VLRWFAKKSPAAIDNGIPNRQVTNLSHAPLSFSERAVLGRGLRFIPSSLPSQAVFNNSISSSMKELTRMMRLRHQFGNKLDSRSDLQRKTYAPNSNFHPKDGPAALEKYLRLTKGTLLQRSLTTATSSFSNLTFRERTHLRSLAGNSAIRIINSDKNLGPVVVDSNWYMKECLRHLNDTKTYQKLDKIQAEALATEAKEELDSIFSSLDDDKLHRFVKQYFTPTRFSKFYILAKLHKTPVVGRPIAAAHSWVTTGAAIYVDGILQPLVQKLPTCLTGTTEIPTSAVLLTADVESLYPSIPIKEGLQMVEDVIVTRLELMLVGQIMNILRIILSFNVIEFADSFWLQIKGTAMGCPAAVVFAQIFMFAVESSVIARIKPLLYKRFIDDVFAICRSRSEAENLITCLNQVNPNIHLTFQISDSSVDFMDLTIFKGPQFTSTSKLDTRLFVKKLNRFLYLPFTSAHPLPVKKGFIRGELIRIIRASSSFKLYLEDRAKFIAHLRVRGYPFRLIKEVCQSVAYKQRHQWLQERKSGKKKNQIPLILKLPFHKRSHAVKPSSAVREHWHVLETDAKLKQLFPRPPLIAYRKGHDLRYWITKWKSHRAGGKL